MYTLYTLGVELQTIHQSVNSKVYIEGTHLAGTLLKSVLKSMHKLFTAVTIRMC